MAIISHAIWMDTVTITTADITMFGTMVIRTHGRTFNIGIRQVTAAIRVTGMTGPAIMTARTGTATNFTKAGTGARFIANGAPATGPIERRPKAAETSKQFS